MPDDSPTGPPPDPEQIFREHAPRIYHLARKMLGNDADAEDVLQDVLLTVMRKLDTFRGDAALTTWLHRVTVNAVLMLRRKQTSRAARELSDPLDVFKDDGEHAHAARPWDAPEARVEEAERKQLLDAAIDRMPEVYRDVLLLADIQEMPNADIADALGLSLPAVKTRLHRARLWLRNELARHFEDPAP